jgi:hypothetical protein
MSLDLTPEGQRAYQILAWAQQDPAGRGDEATRQMNDLARTLLLTGSPALAQVRDAGRMLYMTVSAARTPDQPD